MAVARCCPLTRRYVLQGRIRLDTKVIYVERDKHYLEFNDLFEEYASDLPEEVRSKVVGQLFELPYFHGFICFVNNQPAACAVCYESFSTCRSMKLLNVHDFMVSERYRGKGLGKILLNGIEQYCNANEYLKITLEVNNNNTVAKKLYQSCGFEDYQVEQKDLNHWQKYLV